MPEMPYVQPGDKIPIEEQDAPGWDNVLLEANFICEGDRSAQYGHPYYNYVVIRKMWSAITGVELTFDQCVFMMMALKMGRQLTRESRDNLVDIAGYAWVLEKVKEKADEEGRPRNETSSA